jgi:hypothetical protein
MKPLDALKAFGSLLITLLVFPGTRIRAAESEPADYPVTITAEGGVFYGSVDGFLQTPHGGAPGTSSSHRPTLHELGIDDAVLYEAGLRAQWGHLEGLGGAQFIDLSGSATLSQSLVNHGVTFPAGARVHADASLDWYRAGLGWRFEWAEPHLELTPRVEVALLGFSSELTTDDARAQRSYAKAAARLGIAGAWHFNEWLSLGLDGAASLPFENTPQIATVRGAAQWHLAPRNRWLRPTLFLGAGAEWIDYEDRQQVPNHIDTTFGPLVTGGLSLAF